MKKSLLASAAVIVLGIGQNAMADVSVTVTVNKDKDISVTELITIEKQATVSVTVNNSVTKAAEVDSLINQTNFDNKACENCAEKLDEIINSVSFNSGVTTVNQAAGNMNNQGSVLTAAIDRFTPPGTPPPPGGGGFFGYAEAQAATDQKIGENEVDSIAIEFGR